MIEVAEKIIDILNQAQGVVVNVEVDARSLSVQARSTKTAPPPFITGFGGAEELAEILGVFSNWQGAFEVSGMRWQDKYEFWVN